MSFNKIPSTFNIIPVKDKRPQIAWKEFTERPQTQEEKNQFANCEQVGIVTGKVSGILVLDDDGGLDLEKYKVPKTWTVKTPRGGTHYYFKWDYSLGSKVTTKVGVLPQVDVRGDGGYVVFYGFQRPYFTTVLSAPPQWLIDLLPNKYSDSVPVLGSTEKSKLQELLDDIKPGNRNDSFTRIAGSLRSRGYSSSDMYGMLSPKAREVGFGLNELQIITESVGRYKPRDAEPTESTTGSSIEEFLKDTETVEWIVPGVIAKKSIGFVAGLPETGKTWMLIDLAIEFARPLTGVEQGLWLGKMPVGHGKVLFIDQERFKGETQRRFRSVLSAKGLSASHLSTSLFVRCGTSTRLDLPHSFDAFHKEMSELQPDLVIIDSFATIKVGEENNRTEIQKVLEKIKELRNEFNCTFLFIHHESKAAYNTEESGEPSIAHMSGSVAIPAAAELVLTVRKQDAESSMVYHTKSTLASTISPFLVKVTDENEEKTKIKVEAF